MKIGNTPPNDGVNGASGSGRSEGSTGTTRSTGKAGRSEGGVEASAKVSLSPMAGDLLGGADGSFDAEKVARVKQAIDNGSYKVNAEAIADKLITNAQEVLGRKVS